MQKDYDFSRGTRGPVVEPDPAKVGITIALDENVLDWFRSQVNAAGGGDYQTLINKALREYISTRAEPLKKDPSTRYSRRNRKRGTA